MARNTRQRLIDVAFDLFLSNGFNAVGVDRIIREVGVTKTTFYNHFDSKDDLILAVLEHHMVEEEREMLDALHAHGGRDPRRQLEAVFPVLDQWFRQPDFRGCIFVAASAEFPLSTDPIHRAAMKQKQRWRQIYLELADAAGARDPEVLADQFALLVEGAVIMRSAGGDLESANKAAQAAELLLDAQLPSPEPKAARGAA